MEEEGAKCGSSGSCRSCIFLFLSLVSIYGTRVHEAMAAMARQLSSRSPRSPRELTADLCRTAKISGAQARAHWPAQVTERSSHVREAAKLKSVVVVGCCRCCADMAT